MSSAVARNSSTRQSPIATVASDNVLVGKDVLELLSTAMYVDPMVVFREYVQNAADSIEAARRAGLLEADSGQVLIFIDPAQRYVRIRDDGAGVAPERFVEAMTSLGGSAKRGTAARGFRGVGRLSGLGYAQELVFRSRAEGQADVSELSWDCRALKTALADRTFEASVGDLVARVVTVERRPPAPDEPERFFEVELVRVVRGRSDRLLSTEAVADYLSQVAPVPFDSGFKLGKDIRERLSSLPGFIELDIRINDGRPLTRPHRNEVDLGGRTSAFEDLVFADVPMQSGDGSAAVAWFLHHGYEGALSAGTHVKGVRLRVGNLQIGDGSILEEIFPEIRFNSWSVGEVHVLDPRIVPNGRRDQFEPNVHYLNLLNHVGPKAKDIARRCRTSSARRSKLRDFQLTGEDVRQRLNVIRQGGLDESARGQALASVEAALLKMEKLADHDLLNDAEPTSLIAQVRALQADVAASAEVGTVGDPLEHLEPRERAFFTRMIRVIYAHSVNRNAAKALVDRILEREITGGDREAAEGTPQA